MPRTSRIPMASTNSAKFSIHGGFVLNNSTINLPRSTTIPPNTQKNQAYGGIAESF